MAKTAFSPPRNVFLGGCSYIQAQVQYIKMAPSGGATETDAVRSTLKRPADTHMYAVLAWFSIQNN
jgi:hypothetical protein